MIVMESDAEEGAWREREEKLQRTLTARAQAEVLSAKTSVDAAVRVTRAQQQLMAREERRAEQMRALAGHERALAAREASVERREAHALRLGRA